MPLYAESYHGGIGRFAVTVSPHPVGATGAPRSYAPLSAVHAGSDLAGLALQLVACFLGGALITGVIGAAALANRRRKPPYGAVRRAPSYRRH